jgi:hypothetical protein
MDHEIEGDIDIGRSVQERGYPYRFDEAGGPHHAGKGDDALVIAFKMPHLEDGALPVGFPYESVGLIKSRSYRFFDEHVLPGPKTVKGDLIMRDGRYHDAERLCSVENVPVASKCLRPELCCDRFGPVPVGIDYTDEFGIMEFRIDPGVVLPKITCADHGDFYRHVSPFRNKIATESVYFAINRPLSARFAVPDCGTRLAVLTNIKV